MPLRSHARYLESMFGPCPCPASLILTVRSFSNGVDLISSSIGPEAVCVEFADILAEIILPTLGSLSIDFSVCLVEKPIPLGCRVVGQSIWKIT